MRAGVPKGTATVPMRKSSVGAAPGESLEPDDPATLRRVAALEAKRMTMSTVRDVRALRKEVAHQAKVTQKTNQVIEEMYSELLRLRRDMKRSQTTAMMHTR